MPVHVTVPVPNPKPEWMKQCNLAFFGPASGSPIQGAYCPVGGQTSEIRYQWWPKSESDWQYSPSGQSLGIWMSDDPTLSFEGTYEHKKVIKSNGTEPINANVWVRWWDENGFCWDSAVLKVFS